MISKKSSVGVVCVIVCLVMSLRSADCAAYRFVDIGDPYPPFCAQQFHGKQECSSSYENTILVLSFFTLDQTRSQKVLLDLQDLSIKYANVSFVGILSGEADLQALDEFLETHKIEISILLDPDRKIYGDFGVFMYPSTGIFSQDKRLKYYLPARRINFKTHVDGYIRFLREDISEGELEKIIHPVADTTDPNYKKAENYYNFARVLFEQGKFDQAKKLLESSINASELYAPSYALYGSIHIEEKEYQLGLDKFEAALSIDSELEEAKIGKQICLDNLKE